MPDPTGPERTPHDDTTAPVTAEDLRERVAEKLWNDEQLTPWSRAFGNPEFQYDMEVLFERVDALLALISPALERLRAEQAEAERDAWQRTLSFHLDERDQQCERAERAEAAIERVRVVWSEWRGRLGGAFPPAMVQEIDAALDHPTGGAPDGR